MNAPELIDLDPSVNNGTVLQQQPILNKGKEIIVDQSPPNKVVLLQCDTSKLHNDNLQNELEVVLPTFDEIKGPDVVLDVDLSRINVNPVISRTYHPTIDSLV